MFYRLSVRGRLKVLRQEKGDLDFDTLVVSAITFSMTTVHALVFHLGLGLATHSIPFRLLSGGTQFVKKRRNTFFCHGSIRAVSEAYGGQRLWTLRQSVVPTRLHPSHAPCKLPLQDSTNSVGCTRGPR